MSAIFADTCRNHFYFISKVYTFYRGTKINIPHSHANGTCIPMNFHWMASFKCVFCNIINRLRNSYAP